MAMQQAAAWEHIRSDPLRRLVSSAYFFFVETNRSLRSILSKASSRACPKAHGLRYRMVDVQLGMISIRIWRELGELMKSSSLIAGWEKVEQLLILCVF